MCVCVCVCVCLYPCGLHASDTLVSLIKVDVSSIQIVYHTYIWNTFLWF